MDNMLLCNFDAIDRQHERILDLLKHMATADFPDQETAVACLQELKTTTLEHFDQEETLLCTVLSKDEVDNHSKLHQDFESRIVALMQYLARNRMMNRMLAASTAKWYRDHVLVEDKAILAKVRLKLDLKENDREARPAATRPATEPQQVKTTLFDIVGALRRLWLPS